MAEATSFFFPNVASCLCSPGAHQMEALSPMQALVRLESLYFLKSEGSDNVASAVGWNYSISSPTQPGYIVHS